MLQVLLAGWERVNQRRLKKEVISKCRKAFVPVSYYGYDIHNILCMILL